MNEVRVEIGEGVTVQGPETLIREAMGVPDEVSDAPTFLRDLALSMSEDVSLNHIDALFGDSLSSHPGNARRGDGEGRGQTRRTPQDRGVREIKPVHRSMTHEAGMRVWDVGTGIGPWVLIKRALMKLPVELPVANRIGDREVTLMCPSEDELTARETVFREVEVAAWVVETEPWVFKLIPESCLDPDGRPIELTDEMLEFLEGEAIDETLASIDELDLARAAWRQRVMSVVLVLIALAGFAALYR